MHSLYERVACFDTITVFNAFNANDILFVNNSVSDLEQGKVGEFCEKNAIKNNILDVNGRNDNNQNLNIRNNKVSWINFSTENKWLYNKLSKVILDVNKKYLFDLTDIESLQYTVYSTSEFYQKHIDTLSTLLPGNLTRKLSFSVQLSPPDDYQGGELCIYQGITPSIAPKDLGSITFFPSFLLHEVKPVTNGKRVSLVGWVHGPSFK